MIDTDRIQYITQAGVVFLVFLFIMLVVFYTFSPFIDAFFTSYNALEVGDATDEVQYYGPLFHSAIKIGLAIAVASPVTWFIFWCFHRQPSRYRRRYY